MARSINSPGVQITETDLSNYQLIGGGTNVFIPGFAAQGPTDEVILLTSVTELNQIYGNPTTPAERYFYYSAKEVLNSSANVLTSRLPYGSGSGAGFAVQYSALLYPAASSTTGFSIGQPTHITLDETSYNNIIQNNITWAPLSSTTGTGAYSTTNNILTAGIVVLNNSQVAQNEFFEGYYVALTDNKDIAANTDFTSVNYVYTLSGQDSFFSVPSTRLGFALSGTFASQGSDSVSEVIEGTPTWDFSLSAFMDSLILSVFKIRNSTYEPNTLVYSLVENHIGSLNSNRKDENNKTNYLQEIVNRNSKNINIFVNPAISKNTDWSGMNAPSTPNKSVRIDDSAKAVYSYGVFGPTYSYAANKQMGNIVTKVERALTLVSSPETILIDVVVDGGLTTIAANLSGTSGAGGSYYDDTTYTLTTDLSTENSPTFSRWRTMFNVFDNYVQNTRRDCMFIADPLRQIFLNGNVKNLDIRSNNFTQSIYTPLKNLLNTVNTNYSAIYGNWVKTYDEYTDTFVWTPASGYVASIYAKTDSTTQPWFAPAGLTRGIVNNITDLAFNPNQKQRDYLYTIGVNPIVSFPGDGFVVFGQKTLQNKPSAFDRVNVRRLFLTLERSTQQALKYFVFEPNTEFTRTRLKNTIQPIFELAKNTQGLYDYLIVCDERNNIPDVIDRNELAVDIYLKPVKAAEFILVNFIATRTGQDFQELI